MTRSTLALAALTPLTLIACDGGETNCDAMAMASVSLTVVDPSGEPVAPTAFTFTLDGGEEREVDCMTDDCSEAVAGWEEPGEFVITASYDADVEGDPCCWYHDSVTETITIEQDECHVIGQAVELVLDPAQMICADATDECG